MNKIFTILILLPLAVSSAPVKDSFDWGAGVSGREAVTAGMSVEGEMAQTVGSVWAVCEGAFSGSAGDGNGNLTMTGGQATVSFNYTPDGGWTGGVVHVTVKGSFTPGSGTSRGIWFGFQQTAQDNLLNGVDGDKLFVRLDPAGTITFRSVIGDVTNNAVVAKLSYTAGEMLTFDLSVDVTNRQALLDVTASNGAVSGTLNWAPGDVPAWGAFAVNQTGSSTVILDSVECRSAAGGVRDTFDWGSGVAGRENIAAGRSIAGLSAIGLVPWEPVAGQAVFSGASGAGQGTLTLPGSGTAVRVSCPFTSMAAARVTARYDAVSAAGTNGFSLGFESAAANDHLFVRINSSGEVFLEAAVSGELFSGTGSTLPAFISGDHLQFSLMVNMTSRTASAVVQDLTRGGAATNQLTWTGPADWPFLALNNTDDGSVELQEVSADSLNYIGPWTPFWRGLPVIGEWLAGGQGMEVINDYQRKNSFATQTRSRAQEVPYADNLNVVRLIGGWNENTGTEKPIPADVADLVYKDESGNLQYRWDKLALRLNPYINASYTNLTLVLDNIPYCFPSNIVMESYGQVSTPTNFMEWQTFVSNLCVQLVSLYGFDTANHFRFRQGTEAAAIERFTGTQEDYFKIYDHSAAAIKSVLPDAKFGPFNKAGGTNVDVLQLARHCASGTNYATGAVGGTPFDFFSISDYIAQTNHAHNPQSNADADISYFSQVQAELPWTVPWEVHEFGILNCENNLATDEPGARGAAWDFQMMSRYREGGLSRWCHWGIFDSFRSASGLHKLLTGHGWFLAVLDRTAGGEAVVLEPESTADPATQIRTVVIYGGDRNWILTGVFNPNRTNHTPETVTIRVPQELVSVNERDRILWTSLNQTNAVHYMIRHDLETNGMLNAAFSAVPEQLASVRNMTTNTTTSPEQTFLATLLPKYEQVIIDSLTLKPFAGTVTTNQGELIFTVTLTPPETAVICIGPDQTASGVPYAWLDAQGLATNGYDSAAQADDDSDGMTTGEEYLAGTDPLNTSSLFDVRLQAGQLTWDAVSNRTYRILSSTNLLSGWSLFDTRSVSSNQTIHFPLTEQDSKRFFRLQTGPGL